MDFDGTNQIYLGDGFDHEFTQDGKYLIYFTSDGLHKYNIDEKTNGQLLEIDMGNYLNIEISSIK